MPDFPEYNGDLQPACWYEKFYRHQLLLGLDGGKPVVMRPIPQHAAVHLKVVQVSDPEALGIHDGVLTIAGEVRYKIVGYHVKKGTLLLERI